MFLKNKLNFSGNLIISKSMSISYFLKYGQTEFSFKKVVKTLKPNLERSFRMFENLFLSLIFQTNYDK